MSIDFKNRRVVSFASRQAKKIADLIKQAGGKPYIVPTKREIPLESNTEALAFAKRLLAGHIDALILMTGVGTRLLAKVVASEYDIQKFYNALNSTKIVAMGPKTVAALKEMGCSPDHLVPEPFTWKELLDTLDENLPVENQQVAVQEYGQSNPDLIEGLKNRGAQVTPVPLYRWELPEDLAPMREAIKEIISPEAASVDFALFTSGIQVKHLF